MESHRTQFSMFARDNAVRLKITSKAIFVTVGTASNRGAVKGCGVSHGWSLTRNWGHLYACVWNESVYDGLKTWIYAYASSMPSTEETLLWFWDQIRRANYIGNLNKLAPKVGSVEAAAPSHSLFLGQKQSRILVLFIPRLPNLFHTSYSFFIFPLHPVHWPRTCRARPKRGPALPWLPQPKCQHRRSTATIGPRFYSNLSKRTSTF